MSATSPAPTTACTDLLALGRSHASPVVRAHAKRAAAAVDDLCAALARAGHEQKAS
jgi:hypothetical protein